MMGGRVFSSKMSPPGTCKKFANNECEAGKGTLSLQPGAINWSQASARPVAVQLLNFAPHHPQPAWRTSRAQKTPVWGVRTWQKKKNNNKSFFILFYFLESRTLELWTTLEKERLAGKMWIHLMGFRDIFSLLLPRGSHRTPSRFKHSHRQVLRTLCPQSQRWSRETILGT